MIPVGIAGPRHLLRAFYKTLGQISPGLRRWIIDLETAVAVARPAVSIEKQKTLRRGDCGGLHQKIGIGYALLINTRHRKRIGPSRDVVWGQRPSVIEFNAVVIVRDVHIAVGIDSKADTVVNVNGFELPFYRRALHFIVVQVTAHHSEGIVGRVIGRELPVAVSGNAVMAKNGRIDSGAGIGIAEFENTRRFQTHKESLRLGGAQYALAGQRFCWCRRGIRIRTLVKDYKSQSLILSEPGMERSGSV